MKTAPQTDTEWARQVHQRLRALESTTTTRVGTWVISETEDGRLLAQRPGLTQDVGNPVTEEVDITALRGYVSPTDVAQAVSGGKTSSLSAATENQVQKDIATAGAQYTADNALAQAAQALAALESGPGGVSYNDSFDRALANDFGPDYDSFIGSGGNNYGTMGDGITGMTTTLTGSVNQEWMFRRKDLLNTAQQRVSATWVENPRGGQSAAANAQLRLFGRTNSTSPSLLEGRIEATVEYNRCRIGYYLDATPTTFVPLTTSGDSDGWVLCSTADGDSLDFWIGLGAAGHDRYEFALLRNNLTIATSDDIPENTAPLLANRNGGVGVRTAVVVFFYVTQTVEAPGLQAVNIADRTSS